MPFSNRLSYALDRDILTFTQKFLDNEHSPLPRPTELHNSIVHSNSSLKRRPRSQLQASIQRVLEALKSDREATGTTDMDDSNDREMNRRLTMSWTTHPPVIPSATEATTIPSRSMAISTGLKRSGNMSESVSKKTRKEVPVIQGQDHLSFRELGGIEKIMQQFRRLTEVLLKDPEVFVRHNIDPIHGILLHGPPGCGKTEIAHHFAASMQVSFVPISAPSLGMGSHKESEKALKEYFEVAKRCAPSIVFIDDIDAIIGTGQSTRMSNEARLVPQLLACMDDSDFRKTGGKPVIVIGATKWLHGMDLAFRRAGRFDYEIRIPIPDEPMRKAILEVVARNTSLRSQLDFNDLARRTPGYVGADLRKLVGSIARTAINRYDSENKRAVPRDSTMDTATDSDMLQPEASQSDLTQTSLTISPADIDEALAELQPSLMREGFTSIPNTTWQDVGALTSIKDNLEMSVVLPFTRPDIVEALGGRARPSGVLLWGPPGCGKTLLAKALANACNVNFIGIKGPEMMRKYVGDSEKMVREVFERASDAKPCIVFFDEVDAIAPRRHGESTESSNRVVATLLTEMDGLAERRGICVIGATNRPDIIDTALLRPGRLEKMIFVALPETEERVDILRTQCKAKNMVFNDTIASIARNCERFSGADLDGLCEQARTEATRRVMHDKTGNEVKSVEVGDWEKAVSQAKPSISVKEERRFHKILRQLGA